MAEHGRRVWPAGRGQAVERSRPDDLVRCLHQPSLAYLGATIYRRRTLSQLFGFQPGQYLFGYTLIDARKRSLTVADLTQMRDVKVTHHLTNGFYQHTTFAFAFRDAPTRTWKVSNKQRAERFGQKLDSLQAQARSAFRTQRHRFAAAA
ncbi:hypothetical protein LP420_33170 [Massilia sp. B-10]|nr:hypothetical protein LP420_33170 [Massilia sp. B-10]